MKKQKNSNNQPGTIYLIPSLLGSKKKDLLPEDTTKVIKKLDHFIVEKAKSARRFLTLFKNNIKKLDIVELDKHQKEPDYQRAFKAALEGHDTGIITEAGCPGIADPGQNLAAFAHKNSLKVVPLIGPSSILLALMGSGMNGQKFKFNGYLPINKEARKNEIKKLENESKRSNLTQIFIETPYRSHHLFDDLLNCCPDNCLLSIGRDITLKTELIKTLTIKEWRKEQIDLKKRQVVFLLYSS